MRNYPMASVLDRFWSRVDRSGGPDACWPWTSYRLYGYGKFYVDGKQRQAHNWLLGYLRGTPLVHPEQGNHHCDNRACCNPAHLYIGTQADNIADSIARGHFRNPYIEKLKMATHCKRGHEFTPENTYLIPPSEKLRDGARQCGECRRASWREFARLRRARLRAAA